MLSALPKSLLAAAVSSVEEEDQDKGKSWVRAAWDHGFDKDFPKTVANTYLAPSAPAVLGGSLAGALLSNKSTLKGSLAGGLVGLALGLGASHVDATNRIRDKFLPEKSFREAEPISRKILLAGSLSEEGRKAYLRHLTHNDSNAVAQIANLDVDKAKNEASALKTAADNAGVSFFKAVKDHGLNRDAKLTLFEAAGMPITLAALGGAYAYFKPERLLSKKDKQKSKARRVMETAGKGAFLGLPVSGFHMVNNYSDRANMIARSPRYGVFRAIAESMPEKSNELSALKRRMVAASYLARDADETYLKPFENKVLERFGVRPKSSAPPKAAKGPNDPGISVRFKEASEKKPAQWTWDQIESVSNRWGRVLSENTPFLRKRTPEEMRRAYLAQIYLTCADSMRESLLRGERTPETIKSFQDAIQGLKKQYESGTLGESARKMRVGATAAVGTGVLGYGLYKLLKKNPEDRQGQEGQRGLPPYGGAYPGPVKYASEEESKPSDRIHMTPAVLKEMAKQVGVIGLGTGAGAATAKLLGHLNDEHGWTKNVSSKRMLQAAGAAGTAIPILAALRHEVGMERLREAYDREREQKRKPLPGPER